MIPWDQVKFNFEFEIFFSKAVCPHTGLHAADFTFIVDCFFLYFFKAGFRLDQVYQVQTSLLIYTIPTFPVDLKTLLWAAHKKLRLWDQNLPPENTREMVEDVGVQMQPVVGVQVPEQGEGFVGEWWEGQGFKGGVGGVL